jgi:hypothetical protein
MAEKLTCCVQQIIEFSKMIPGFLTLIQDDQITLLKDGSFGVMLLYLSQSYITERNSFIYNNTLINIDIIIHNLQYLDDNEKYFIQDNIEFLRQLKQFNLTDSELALISAIILFNPDNKELNDQKLIYQYNQRFIEILRLDIENNRNDTQLLQQILSILNRFIRPLTRTHFELLTNFKLKYAHIEFPPLHKELFNVEYYIYYNHHHQQQQHHQQLVSGNNENSTSPTQQQQQQQQVYHIQPQQQQQQQIQYHHGNLQQTSSPQQQIPYFSNQYNTQTPTTTPSTPTTPSYNNQYKQQVPTYQIYIQSQPVQQQQQQQQTTPQQQYAYLNTSPQNDYKDVTYPTVSSTSSTASSSSSSSSSSPNHASPTSSSSPSYAVPSTGSYASLIKSENQIFNTNNMPIGIDTA